MNRQNANISRGALWLGLFGVLVAANALQADAAVKMKKSAEAKRKTVTVTVLDSADGRAGPSEVTVQVHTVRPGKYWLGIVCAPVEDELIKRQLGIRGGLVVEHVVPHSPATVAGLQPYDILVKAGNRPLTDLKTLVAAVDSAQGKPWKLTILRQGKRQQLTITPAKRPAKVDLAVPDRQAVSEWKVLAQTLRKYGIDLDDADRALDTMKTRRFYFVMPGVVVPEGTQPIPEDLEVTITKKGEKPAHVVVRQGGKKWEVDENSLDKLPEDIRPHVRKMLGGSSTDVLGDVFPFQPRALKQLTPKMFYSPDGGRLNFDAIGQLRQQIERNLNRMQQQLDTTAPDATAEMLKNIRRQLQQMRQQLEQIRQRQQTTPHEKQREAKPKEKGPQATK